MRTVLKLFLPVAIVLSLCSCSSGDEPDGPSVGMLTEEQVQERQQMMQDEFLNSRCGIKLSEGITEVEGVYSYMQLFSAMYNTVTDPIEPGTISGPPSWNMPLFVMTVRDCEPVLPCTGVAFEPYNYNLRTDKGYPLVAEGGIVRFPVIKLYRDIPDLGDPSDISRYTITDFYVQVNGATIEHFSSDEFGELSEHSKVIGSITDEGGEKRITILKNTGSEPRRIWLKFVDPSCEFLYENAANNLYFDIYQETFTGR